MSPELDKKLVEKYPEIFKNRFADPSETCMCWGFSCGDGWYNIIDQLCRAIEAHQENNKKSIEWAIDFNKELEEAKANEFQGWADWRAKEPREVPEEIAPVVAIQVKEKYGTLRFYYSGGDDFVEGAVWLAEMMSAVTCEECGAPASLERDQGYFQTLCDKHREEKGYY